jgi:hypothetical protein
MTTSNNTLSIWINSVSSESAEGLDLTISCSIVDKDEEELYAIEDSTAFVSTENNEVMYCDQAYTETFLNSEQLDDVVYNTAKDIIRKSCVIDISALEISLDGDSNYFSAAELSRLLGQIISDAGFLISLDRVIKSVTYSR